MKVNSLLLFFCLFLSTPSVLGQQKPCADYACVIGRVKKALADNNYRVAFEQLESAEGYNDKNVSEITSLRKKLFDAVEKQNKDLLAANIKINKEKERVENATTALKKQIDSVKTERERADNQAKAAELSELQAFASYQDANYNLKLAVAQKIVIKAKDALLSKRNAAIVLNLYEMASNLIPDKESEEYKEIDLKKKYPLFENTFNHDTVILSILSPNKKLIASALSSNKIFIWDIAQGKTTYNFEGHKDLITHIVFSPDSKNILTNCTDKTVKLWSLDSNKLRHTFGSENKAFTAIAFSPNGNIILTANAYKITLWDEFVRNELGYITKESPIISAVFSPDSKYIICANLDNTAKLWEVSSRNFIRDFRGHKDKIYNAEFSPSGRFIYTESLDKTARLWDVATGKLLKVLRGIE